MHVNKDSFNNVKAALKVERNRATDVAKYWKETIPFGYDTILKVSKCDNYEEYKEKYQPSKVAKCHDHTPAGIGWVRLDVKPTSEEEMHDWMEHISNQLEEISKRLENLKIIF